MTFDFTSVGVEDIIEIYENAISSYKKYAKSLESVVEDLEDELEVYEEERENENVMPAIKYITYCDEPGKEKVIVVFEDNTKVIKAPMAGDQFDLNVGVALCIAERMFGSKSKFHKFVKRNIKNNK